MGRRRYPTGNVVHVACMLHIHLHAYTTVTLKLHASTMTVYMTCML